MILELQMRIFGTDVSGPSRLVAGEILACREPTLSILNGHLFEKTRAAAEG
jgi:hypothetical protein